MGCGEPEGDAPVVAEVRQFRDDFGAPGAQVERGRLELEHRQQHGGAPIDGDHLARRDPLGQDGDRLLLVTAHPTNDFVAAQHPAVAHECRVDGGELGIQVTSAGRPANRPRWAWGRTRRKRQRVCPLVDRGMHSVSFRSCVLTDCRRGPLPAYCAARSRNADEIPRVASCVISSGNISATPLTQLDATRDA